MSDAYYDSEQCTSDEVGLELVTTMININSGYNDEIKKMYEVIQKLGVECSMEEIMKELR